MSFRSVVAIGAHPDDAILGAGGTLARLALEGADVTILTLTRGELGGDPAVREVEEIEAARRIGAKALFADLPDGDISQRLAMNAISRVLAAKKPDLVLVHAPDDSHQDHVAASRAATSACRLIPTLMYYEGPSTTSFEPTSWSDVSATWNRKISSLEAHASQMGARELFAWTESVAHFRAWPRYVGKPVESFRMAHGDVLSTPQRPLHGDLHLVTTTSGAALVPAFVRA